MAFVRMIKFGAIVSNKDGYVAIIGGYKEIKTLNLWFLCCSIDCVNHQ